MIYSNHQIHLHNQRTTGNLVAEEYHGEPLSFMSMLAWKNLVDLSHSSLNFIPTTTRTLRQYRRVAFPDVKVPAAVVLNGARILIDGIEDYDWTKKVAADVKNLEFHPVRVWEKLSEGLKESEEVKAVHSADDFFTYVVAKSAKCPDVDAYTADLAAETGYVRSKQGRKTYLIPKTLTKGHAVRELISRLDASTSFAAGDSVLDFSMIPEVDYFIQPSHGDKTPVSDNLTRTPHKGIHASEDILTFIRTTLGS